MWVNLFVALILEVSGAVIPQYLKKNLLKGPLLLFVAKQNDLELQQVSLGCLCFVLFFPQQNFVYKWDRSHSCSVTDVERIRYETSVQLIFKSVYTTVEFQIYSRSISSLNNCNLPFLHCRSQIQEPTEEELLCQLRKHPHLELHGWCHFSTLIKLWLLQRDLWYAHREVFKL